MIELDNHKATLILQLINKEIKLEYHPDKKWITSFTRDDGVFVEYGVDELNLNTKVKVEDVIQMKGFTIFTTPNTILAFKDSNGVM